jgi:hypothetical protein
VRNRHPGRRQRATRLVDPVDLEIVDLIQRVRRRVEHRRHDQTDQWKEDQIAAERLRWRGAGRGRGTRREAERGRDQREGTRQLEEDGSTPPDRHSSPATDTAT